MRILMIVSSTSLMDGINRHVLSIAPALNSFSDVEVGVVTLHSWGALNDELKKAGVKCWSLGCENGHQLKVVRRFWRVMREFRPQIVHDHVMAFWESVLLRWVFRDVRTVNTIHGVGDSVAHVTLRMRLERLMFMFALRKRDAYIFISKGVRDVLAGTDSAAAVVYNPISFNTAAESSPENRERRNVKVVGTACRFAAQKNLEVMVRVMAAVVKRCPNVEAWMIGDGPDAVLNNRLRDIVKAEHVESNIEFLGYQKDVLSLVSKMDCFLMTSHWEGMPTSLLEAMSVKTPIAFMVGDGGLQDLAEMNRVEGPFAVVAERGDESAMADGVCGLLNDAAQSAAYAERAFEVGRRHFDLPVVARQIKEVYEKCLKED